MYARLFSTLFSGTGHLLALPVFSLLLFIAIFAMVVVRVVRKSPEDFAAVAALPMEKEEGHE